MTENAPQKLSSSNPFPWSKGFHTSNLLALSDAPTRLNRQWNETGQQEEVWQDDFNLFKARKSSIILRHSNLARDVTWRIPKKSHTTKPFPNGPRQTWQLLHIQSYRTLDIGAYIGEMGTWRGLMTRTPVSPYLKWTDMPHVILQSITWTLERRFSPSVHMNLSLLKPMEKVIRWNISKTVKRGLWLCISGTRVVSWDCS